MMATLFKALATCAAALLLVQPVAAQDDAAAHPDQLTGTLQKIKASGVVRIGHRLSSSPFSYLDARGQPIGYSLDLCQALVEDIAMNSASPNCASNTGR